MAAAPAKSQQHISEAENNGMPKFHVARDAEVEYGESWNALQAVCIVEFLRLDSRPTLVLDLHFESKSSEEPLRPVFINSALFRSKTLNDFIESNRFDGKQTAQPLLRSFLSWARDLHTGHQSLTSQFAGTQWEAMTLRDRWRILIAHPHGAPKQTLTSERELERVPDLPIAPVINLPGMKTQNDETRSTNGVADGLPTNTRNVVADNLPVSRRTTYANEHLGALVTSDKRDSVSAALQVSKSNDKYDYHSALRNAELLSMIAKIGVVAIWAVNNEGDIIFANDRWHELTQFPRESREAMTWIDIYEDDELPRVMDVWKRVLKDREPVQYQARLKPRWKPSSAYPAAPLDLPTWITAWAYPDIDTNGKMLGACGVWTDISELKWGEQLAAQKLADAEERAKLLEQLSLRGKEVAETETRFRRVCDMMPCGVWMSDADGRMLYVNTLYSEFFPPARGSTAPQPWFSMILPHDLAQAHDFYKRVQENGGMTSIEIRIKKSLDSTNSEYRWILAVVYPEFADDGQLRYLTGCVTDISHLKAAEELQSTRASDAVESKRQLERFIDMTSHEIRNPLSAILHSAEEILSSLHGQSSGDVIPMSIADAKEAAETIILCTEHSTRIVDDILLVSKLESGLLNISPTIVQPVKVIESALRMFDSEMRAAHISQSFTADESFRKLQVDWVHLDAIRVRQIFVNLITNAIKFTRLEETRHINVHMKASTERPIYDIDSGGQDIHYLAPLTERSTTDLDYETNKQQTVYITVSVQDTGCGLTTQEQKRLFQRFTQAGTRTHIKYGGTGLGLFISRQLCEMQGGQIGLKSMSKEGSTFSFYVMVSRALPPSKLSRTSSEDIGLRQRTSTLSLTTLNSNTSANCERSLSEDATRNQLHHTILLVEDNLINQKVVAKKLTTQSYKVVVANHGAEAVDRIKESALWSEAIENAPSISLILLDLEMPIMDGLTCIRRLREMEQLNQIRCHVPVIAVTANARRDQIEEALEAGMDDVITKPFRVNQIFPMMERLMKQFPVSS